MDSPLSELRFIKGLAPAADRWNSNPATDVVSLRDYNKCTFLVEQEGGTTGDATITVEACDDVTPSNTTAIAFKYRVGGAASTAGTGDQFGAIVDAASTGFVTTANSHRQYLIEIEANDLLASGYSFVRLKATEDTNDPVNGSVQIILSQPRYIGLTPPNVLA